MTRGCSVRYLASCINSVILILHIKMRMVFRMWQDFKKFAFKGNVIDMAVGVIIGSAFGKIVSSIVNDIMMPLLGMLTGGVDFSAQKFVMSEAVVDATGKVVKEEAAILYGAFIQNVIDFLIISISIFFFMRFIVNRIKKKEEAAAAEPPKPTTEELLGEIITLMKEKKEPETNAAENPEAAME